MALKYLPVRKRLSTRELAQWMGGEIDAIVSARAECAVTHRIDRLRQELAAMQAAYALTTADERRAIRALEVEIESLEQRRQALATGPVGKRQGRRVGFDG